MNKLKIVFIGSPDFAVASLQMLLTNNYNVVAIITAMDKPAGRGLVVQKSAIKIFAEEHNIDVLQPSNLKSTEFLDLLKNYNADLQIVVAFRMLPQAVWAMPSLGTINVHASLLPNYRGAAPIHWAVINGETETGVSTFRLKHEIDTGNILLQKKVPIEDKDTTGSMYEKLKIEGAMLLLLTLKKIEDDENFNGTEQVINKNNQQYKLAPKILSEHTKINWNDCGRNIINQIRGLAPSPCAQTILNKKLLKIIEADFECNSTKNLCEEIITDNKTFLKFGCKDGYIYVLQLQLEGKKKMKVGDFLKGYSFIK